MWATLGSSSRGPQGRAVRRGVPPSQRPASWSARACRVVDSESMHLALCEHSSDCERRRHWSPREQGGGKREPVSDGLPDEQSVYGAHQQTSHESLLRATSPAQLPAANSLPSAGIDSG